jgi:glycosyltransferase involved in cell wall biosynthesis
MKIGFDAKRLYHNKTGLGAYARNLIKALMKYEPQHTYRLLVHQKFFEHSPYKYKEFVEKTLIADHLVADYWRLADIKDDIESEALLIYHGLSNEIPITKPSATKMVVTIHDLIFLKHPEFFPFIDRNIYTYKTKKACENADIVIAVSENTKQDIMANYGIAAEKIHVIAPTWGSEYDVAVPIVYLEEIRSKYALPEQFILYVGALHRRKNISALITAYSRSNLDQIPIIIVSDGGDDEQHVRQTIYDTGMEGNVYILENIPNYELTAFYKMASLCVYPSIYEGFGMPIMEAMHLGVPVAASDIPPIHEVGGDSILYFDPQNLDAMADAIYKGISDDAWRTDAINNGKAHVQQFSPESCATKTVGVYERLIT